MRRVILWSQDAREDIEEIILFIKDRSGSEIARSIYQRIIERIEKLTELSKVGRKVPELSILGNHEYHEIIESPWRIIYRIDEKEVRIISILDGRRNVEEILYKKMIDGKLI